MLYPKHLMQFSLIGLLACSVLACSCKKQPTPEDPVVPRLKINGLSIYEGDADNTVDLLVELSEATTEVVIINYRLANESAVIGEDFSSPATTLTIAPGEVTASLPVTIVGDTLREPDETFRIVVNSVDNATNISTNVTVTIKNDDENVIIPVDGYATPTSYAGYKLVWQDEFNGNAVSNDWTFEIGDHGWGNNELQYYTNGDNVTVNNGKLIIEARKESFQGAPYTSTRMITMNKQSFQYGRVDIRAVLPEGQGIWPALWMLGSNFSSVGWPACGEIDIMELVGHEPSTVHGTVHWDNNGHAEYGNGYTLSSGKKFGDEFHVFSIIWDENSIKWYVNDIQFNEVAITQGHMTEFHAPFFFIFNIAVGGNWPGYPDATTVFPQQMVVDYVRVFQRL